MKPGDIIECNRCRKKHPVYLKSHAGQTRYEARMLFYKCEPKDEFFAGAADVCARCQGDRWVCEDHRDQPLEHEGCRAAGEPCPDCNTGTPPAIPPGFASVL